MTTDVQVFEGDGGEDPNTQWVLIMTHKDEPSFYKKVENGHLFFTTSLSEAAHLTTADAMRLLVQMQELRFSDETTAVTFSRLQV